MEISVGQISCWNNLYIYLHTGNCRFSFSQWKTLMNNNFILFYLFSLSVTIISFKYHWYDYFVRACFAPCPDFVWGLPGFLAGSFGGCINWTPPFLLDLFYHILYFMIKCMIALFLMTHPVHLIIMFYYNILLTKL
jgi:hypothetical protein